MFACSPKTGSNSAQNQNQGKKLSPDTSGMWTDLPMPPAQDNSTIKPESYRLLALDLKKMKQLLLTAPSEKEKETKTGILVNIPMPEGTYEVFMVYETQVMAPELAAKYPEIKTYGGNGVTQKSFGIRLDFTPNGFHALVSSLKGGINIDPYKVRDVKTYICYYKQEFNPTTHPKSPVDSIK